MLAKDDRSRDDTERLRGETEQSWQQLADARRRGRIDLLERTARAGLDPDEAFRRLEAMRWLDRLGYHTYRSLHHVLAAKDAMASIGIGDSPASPPAIASSPGAHEPLKTSSSSEAVPS